MIKSPFFSIIVPVYNCEKYLAQCIESVISQSFDDWELLLIDDGSSDTSGAICDAFSENDPRIKVVHKTNGGEFSARKAGLDISEGVYITGLDADDYYEENHLKDIYAIIQRHHVDCVSFPFHYVGARDWMTDVIVPCGSVVSGDDFLLTCIKRNDSSICDKAIKGDCYKSVDYSDAPPIRFSEDEIMVIPALCNVNSACGANICSYRYRIHDQSVSGRHDFRHIEYLDEAVKYCSTKIREADRFTETVELAYMRSFLHSLNVRVWDLFLSRQWNDEMTDRLKPLLPGSGVMLKKILEECDLRERMRIRLIIKEKYGSLKMLARLYNFLGKTSAI